MKWGKWELNFRIPWAWKYVPYWHFDKQNKIYVLNPDYCCVCNAPSYVSISWLISVGRQEAFFCNKCAREWWKTWHSTAAGQTATIRPKERTMQDVTQNTQTPTMAPDTRKIIGTNPDGTPIFEEAFVQTPAHTGTESAA